MSVTSTTEGLAGTTVVVVVFVAVGLYVLDLFLPSISTAIKKAFNDAIAGTTTNLGSGAVKAAGSALRGTLTGVGKGIDQAVGASAGSSADQVNQAESMVPSAGFGPDNELTDLSNGWEGIVNWLRTGNFATDSMLQSTASAPSGSSVPDYLQVVPIDSY